MSGPLDVVSLMPNRKAQSGGQKKRGRPRGRSLEREQSGRVVEAMRNFNPLDHQTAKHVLGLDLYGESVPGSVKQRLDRLEQPHRRHERASRERQAVVYRHQAVLKAAGKAETSGIGHATDDDPATLRAFARWCLAYDALYKAEPEWLRTAGINATVTVYGGPPDPVGDAEWALARAKQIERARKAARRQAAKTTTAKMTTDDFKALGRRAQEKLTAELLGEELPPPELRAYDPRYIDALGG